MSKKQSRHNIHIRHQRDTDDIGSYLLGASYQYIKQNWGLEVEIASGQVNFKEFGTMYNIKRTSNRIFLNWYYPRNPVILGKWIPFLGAGTGLGKAKLKAPGRTLEYKYDSKLAPLWQIGARYRFKAGDTRNEIIRLGFGIDILLRGEFINLQLLDFTENNISSQIKGNKWSTSVGFNVSF